MKLKKSKETYTYLDIGEFCFPLKIVQEFRRSTRVSIGKDNIILRIPYLSFSSLDSQIDFVKSWIYKLMVDRPDLLAKFRIEHFDQKEITLFDNERYVIDLLLEESNSGKLKLEGNRLKVLLPNQISNFDQSKMVRVLISKILGKRYQQKVEQRVAHWNDLHFKKPIEGVFIKYNSSNWGSCSTKNRINISTRALLLPPSVFDYIIVHELSHLVEMNHSERYWQVVKNVMPNYKEHEAWLKRYGHSIPI